MNIQVEIPVFFYYFNHLITTHMKNKKPKPKYIGRMKQIGKGMYSREEITDPNKKTQPIVSFNERRFF